MRSSVPPHVHTRGVWKPLALLAVLGASVAGSVACQPTACCAPNPNPIPPGPERASVTVTAGTPTVTLSDRPGFTYRLSLNSSISETEGLGANINYVRMDFIRAPARVEIQEISSADLIAQTGSNRLNGGSSRNLDLVFHNNAETATSAVLLYDLTDDHANHVTGSFLIKF